jgi:hypothetical protein
MMAKRRTRRRRQRADAVTQKERRRMRRIFGDFASERARGFVRCSRSRRGGDDGRAAILAGGLDGATQRDAPRVRVAAGTAIGSIWPSTERESASRGPCVLPAAPSLRLALRPSSSRRPVVHRDITASRVWRVCKAHQVVREATRPRSSPATDTRSSPKVQPATPSGRPTRRLSRRINGGLFDPNNRCILKHPLHLQPINLPSSLDFHSAFHSLSRAPKRASERAAALATRFSRSDRP